MTPWTDQVREKIGGWPGMTRKIIGAQRAPLVLANGVYDLLHPGHVENLQEASELGGFLLVALDVDHYVETLKGRPPAMEWRDRAFMVACLPFVDAVTGHYDLTKVIRNFRPDVWAARAEALPAAEIVAAEEVGARILRLSRHGSWESSQIRLKSC